MLRTRLPYAAAVTAGVVAALVLPTAAQAAPPYPSDSAKPDLVALLGEYTNYWQPTTAGTPPKSVNDLTGKVVDPAVLAHDDEIAVWINQHATKAEQFLALQDSEYQNTPTQYDQSLTISTGLGSILGPLYVQGRLTGKLPLTTALVNSETGTSGAYVGTGDAKAAFSHPRPYLPSDAATPPVAGDDPACDPSTVNAASQAAIRKGTAWADANGNLKITRVPATTDTTKQFSSADVTLDAGYGTPGICKGGSFPSGHTTTAYQAGFTLATLLPELAPEILTRASEAGNDRIVLGVHYPLDIIGGRIDGEVALATRWSDEKYRTEVLEPARAELVKYLEQASGGTLAAAIAKQKAYTSDPYGGQAVPGGSSQIVTDRASAVQVFHERLTYGFPEAVVNNAATDASVPAGASNLLLTTFPTLTDAQRTSVLAQTEIGPGFPLDQAGASWQRLDLAAATSATVELAADGTVTVKSVGGAAAVVPAGGTTTGPSTGGGSTTGPVTSSSAGPILANTGSSTGTPLLASVLLLVTGTAIVTVANVRRRRGAHRH